MPRVRSGARITLEGEFPPLRFILTLSLSLTLTLALTLTLTLTLSLNPYPSPYPNPNPNPYPTPSGELLPASGGLFPRQPAARAARPCRAAALKF